MWSTLPVHVIIKIFGYIEEPESKIAAATTCRNWRDIVFDSQDVVLKRKHEFRFTCGKQQIVLVNEQDVEAMLKCVPHVETLVFEWCNCKTNALLDVLSKIVEKPLAVKQIKFRGNITLSRTCNKVLDGGVIERKKSLVCSLMKCSKRLEALDLGIEPDLAQSEKIMQEINAKLSSDRLATLNIAALRNPDLAADSFYMKMNKLNMLTTLCLSWDKNLVELIKVLSEDSDSQSRLKQLIVVVSSLNCLEDHSVPEQHIPKVAKFHPELNLKLVLISGHIPISRPFHQFDAYEQINIMLGFNRVSFTLVTNEPEADEFLISLLVWGAEGTRPTLKELSMHYVEVERNVQLCELHGLTGNANLMFTGLERLELCGMFIEDMTVVDLAATLYRLQTPSVFRDLVVYRMDVLCMSETTDLLLPITSSQVNYLQGAISESLGRDWKLVRERHLNRERSGGNIQSKFRSALRDVCEVVK